MLCCLFFLIYFWEQGVVARVLASHQSGLGLILSWWYAWVKFVVGSCPCSKGFSRGPLIFFPLQKLAFLNSNLIKNSGQRATMWKCQRIAKPHLFYLQMNTISSFICLQIRETSSILLAMVVFPWLSTVYPGNTVYNALWSLNCREQ